MYPILYSPGHIDFNNLGLGIMVDTTTATATEELNGKFELDLQYLSDGPLAQALVYDALVKVPTGDQVDQLFRIKTIVEKIDGVLSVHAEHVSYITNDLPIKPKTAVMSSDAQMALNQALGAIADKHPLTAYSDITSISSTNWFVPDFKSPRNILGGVEGSILDHWGGEYQFNNYQIRLLKQRGQYSNTIIAYGRNLTDFEQEESILETFTSVYPYTNETSGDKTTLHTLPEIVVDSEYVTKYPNRRVLMVDFSDKFNEDNKYSDAKLRKLAQDYIKANKVGVPKVTMTVSTVDLSRSLDESYNVEEVESLHLADTVKVFFEPLGVTAETKVVGVVWNVLLEQYDSYTLGSKKASFSQWVNNSVSDAKDAAEHAKQTAISAVISANGKNTNYYGNSGDGFPPQPNVGDLYFQKDGDQMTIYQWEGTSWVNTIDTKWQADFEAEMQEKLDTAKKELDDAIAANNEALVDLDTALTENTKELSDVKDTLAQNQTDLDNLSELTDNATQAGIQAQAAADEAKKESASATAAANNALTQALNGIGLAQIVQNDLNDTKSVVGQLSDSITLAVMKNDVINQINVSTEGIVIAGKRVSITGQTYIENGVIGNAQIADAAIDSAKVRDITADKLVIGQGGNIVANPDFFKDTINVEPIGWSGGIVRPNPQLTGINKNPLLLKLVPSSSTNVQALSKDFIKVSPGEVYSIKAQYFSTSSFVQVGFRGYNGKQEPAEDQWIHVQSNASGIWKNLEGEVTIPEGVQYIQIRLATGPANPASDLAAFGNIDIRRKQDYSLIVNGAILARHLATDSVTANAIMAGAVTTSKLYAGAITAEKIAANAVTTNHLAANSVTANQLAAGAVNMGSATVTGTLDASRIRVINLDASELKAGTINAAQVRIINLDVANLTGNLTNFVKTQWNAGFGSQVAINSNSIVLNTATANMSLTSNALRIYSSSFGSATGVFALGKWGDKNGNLTSSVGIYIGASKEIHSNTDFTAFTDKYGDTYMMYASSAFVPGANTNISKGALNIFRTTTFRDNVGFYGANTNIRGTTNLFGSLLFTRDNGRTAWIEFDSEKRTLNFKVEGDIPGGSYFWFNQKIISADGWASSSLLSLKNVKKEYDGDALGEICKTQLVEYSYKNRPWDKELSPIIDDVNETKQYYIPDIITDGKTVNNYAMQSLSWAAIKQLNEKIEELEKKIA